MKNLPSETGVRTVRESLKRSRDFAELFDKGSRYSNRTAAIRVIRTPVGLQRLGLSVSKKVGGAVVRNRLKRIFRETFRQEAGRMLPGLDLLIIARKGAETASSAEVREALKELFRRARLYAEDGR